MANLKVLKNKLDALFEENATSYIQYKEVTLIITKEHLLEYMTILRDDEGLQFSQLIDLCAIDYLHFGEDEWSTNKATSKGFSRGVENKLDSTVLTHPARFAVVYHLLSVNLNQRIRVKVFVGGEPPVVPSICEVFRCANWYEREAFDLYGVHFTNHPDLRRILSDYGFIGYPFRKDYPLVGKLEIRYDATLGRCVYEPCSIEPRVLVPKVIRAVELPEEEIDEAEQLEHPEKMLASDKEKDEANNG